MGRGLATAGLSLGLCALAATVEAQAACPAGTEWIPAGELWVGSPYGECPDEAALPRERARVRAMCIDPAPVSVAEYERCVATGRCPARVGAPECASDPERAADCVSFEAARRYCAWRAGHVPTEAQLDHALRTREETDDLAEWTATRADQRRPWLPRGRGGGARDRIVRWSASHLGEAQRWDAALPELAFRCRFEPSVEATPPPLVGAWSAPRCLAYSTADDAYACLDFGLTTDDTGAAAFAPMDFTGWSPPYDDLAWGGHEAVLLVTASRQRALAVASRDYIEGGPIRRVRSAAAALRLAASHGYGEPVGESAELPSGRWIPFQGFWLRFETRLHVGGASEYHVGSLRLACDDPSRPGVATRELLDDRRGESAIAFAARGAPSFVVGVMQQGGGEGSGYFQTRYVHVGNEDCP